MFMALVILFALALLALFGVLAWASQSWWVLLCGLAVAWFTVSLGLYAEAPGHPQRFGEP